jgi:hypothetical protein
MSMGLANVRAAAAGYGHGEPANSRAVARGCQLLDQLRLHRLLVDLVLALDEPYRATIVARFVDGCSAAELARSLGIPESTVRGRLREGLGRLRANLDERQGRRKAWAPGMACHRRSRVRDDPVLPCARSDWTILEDLRARRRPRSEAQPGSRAGGRSMPDGRMATRGLHGRPFHGSVGADSVPGSYTVSTGFFTGWAGRWVNMPLTEAPLAVRGSADGVTLAPLALEPGK